MYSKAQELERLGQKTHFSPVLEISLSNINVVIHPQGAILGGCLLRWQRPGTYWDPGTFLHPGCHVVSIFCHPCKGSATKQPSSLKKAKRYMLKYLFLMCEYFASMLFVYHMRAWSPWTLDLLNQLQIIVNVGASNRSQFIYPTNIYCLI